MPSFFRLRRRHAHRILKRVAEICMNLSNEQKPIFVCCLDGCHDLKAVGFIPLRVRAPNLDSTLQNRKCQVSSSLDIFSGPCYPVYFKIHIKLSSKYAPCLVVFSCFHTLVTDRAGIALAQVMYTVPIPGDVILFITPD